ncbi:MAG: serine/threonine protein kinase [Oligoflexia bacterium]|nr:serine/threonine protein kinase [Oligoflexia bacterium]
MKNHHNDTPLSMSDFFYDLTPEHILSAIEQVGQRSTGRCYALNSLENRVYEVELEDNSKVVGKFYRPGRWTRDAILEEHEFLKDLAAAEIPVAEPLKLQDGSTLGTAEGGIMFSVFPKLRGRAPEELNDQQLLQLGRFLGRIHNVGASKKASHRILLTPETYGVNPLKFLSENNWLSLEIATRYKQVVQEILDISTPWFANIKTHRIHGDCHLGNLLYNNDGPFFLDFDDMVTGPPVQDLWLLVPGNDEQALKDRDVFLKGYTEMREFDFTSLRLVEPLRAFRFIHYSAWIAKRWKDPAFPRIFPDFNTHKYWSSELLDLEKQLNFIKTLN